jgi:hypothetical protein
LIAKAALTTIPIDSFDVVVQRLVIAHLGDVR